MEQQVYFVINHDELILDKVLVEYNEEPIFFVCKHEQDYYIVSCADMEEERYIVTRTTLNRLSKMLHERMTMRELILDSDKFWDVIVGEDVTEDIVIEKKIDQIPTNVLPYEGAYLKVATRDLKEYVERIDSILYGEGIWERKITQDCAEYINELVEIIYERYETVFQTIYESVIKGTKSDFLQTCDKDVYDKEIYNLKIQVNAKEAEMDVILLNSDKSPFAA
ncbi:MAG: hypothetical protein HDR13_13715 [Lachnospiraceae bacterium]|nr:hypothetical protein [Lachnospiraceae bacterium]